MKFIKDFKFDLILWGHEHEAKKKFINKEELNFKIYQPGSTVATSLNKFEQTTKSVGMISFTKEDFQLETFDLERPRKIFIEEYDLETLLLSLPNVNVDLEQKIVDFIVKNFGLHQETPPEKKPLVRIKIALLRS